MCSYFLNTLGTFIMSPFFYTLGPSCVPFFFCIALMSLSGNMLERSYLLKHGVFILWMEMHVVVYS
jgi:hypothetical protein